MHALVYRAKEDFRLEEIATPTLSPGELLVQVEAVTVCGVDLRTFRHGDAKIAPPRILGHEFCGTVVASAADDASAQIGDRVVMFIVMACGTCRYCRDGRSNLCLTRTTMSYQHDGAFAQYVKIPAAGRRQLYKVPEHIPSTHAAICEPLGCVLNAHSRIDIGFRDEVVIMGAGPIGVMHGVAARERGARKVILCDVSQERLTLCERFGFDHYVPVKEQGHLDAIKRLTDGYGPSVVIVAVGAAQAQADALEMAAKGGRVEFFGGLPKSKPTALLNTNHLHYKELLVSGSYSEKPSDFEAAQALVFSGRFPAAKLVTHELSLERATEAFPLMEQGSALKVCITPTI